MAPGGRPEEAGRQQPQIRLMAHQEQPAGCRFSALGEPGRQQGQGIPPWLQGLGQLNGGGQTDHPGDFCGLPGPGQGAGEQTIGPQPKVGGPLQHGPGAVPAGGGERPAGIVAGRAALLGDAMAQQQQIPDR